MAIEKKQPKTKLSKYPALRLFTIFTKYSVLFAITALLLVLAPIATPFFFIGYFYVAIWATIILVVCSLGLLLINASSDPTNPLYQLWDVINHLDEYMEKVYQFAKIAVPIALAINIIFIIVGFVLVKKGATLRGEKRDKTSLGWGLALGIITTIFYVIMLIAHAQGA